MASFAASLRLKLLLGQHFVLCLIYLDLFEVALRQHVSCGQFDLGQPVYCAGFSSV